MGRGFRKGVGGVAKPKQIFLYKKGTDNTELTGGLTMNGYSYSSQIPATGTITFEQNDVLMDVLTSGKSASICGTTVTVPLVNYKSAILKYRKDNVDMQLTLDLSGVANSRYISVSFINNVSSYLVRFYASTTKSNMSQASDTIYANSPEIYGSAHSIYIDSIELIPMTNRLFRLY